jgi:alkylation response protein AidB-like acyl-CoA dehydrogenase
MIPVLSDREAGIVETARGFAQKQVAPHAAGWELARQAPLETFRAAAGAGLTGLLVPEALGGAGLSYTGFAQVMEELAAACLPFAFMLEVHNNLGGNVARNGSEAQRERFLPPLLKGERVGAFCLTEPGAGSDAAAITTAARPDGEAWVLDGEKAWVSNGTVAGLFSVYAQTDPAKGWRGIACLLAEEETPGLERGPPYALLGGHALGTAGLTLKDCRVPAHHLLLPAGEAFRAAMEGIDIARTTVAAMCCGMLRVGLETALAHAADRRAFGRPVASFQGVQWQLADVATDLEAARLLTYAATRAIDAGEAATVAAAHAKKFATRAALQGLSECMQAMGAAGLRAEHPLGRHLASAKIAQYLDGTTEIQNVVISRALLKGRRAEEA